MATSRKRNIEIEVVVDDKQVRSKLGNIEQSVTKTGKAFSTAGKLVAGAFAGREVIQFALESIEAFSDLNESTNAVRVTFGDAADAVLQLGEQSAESLGLANSEFNSLAVGFAAFVDKVVEGGGGTVPGVLDDLTTRIADFASVMNLDVAEAAEKFRSGLAGETEPLRKFGIDVSAAAVNAKALQLGLAGTTSELTEADKVFARYRLIMEQTDKTAGDFQNTSDELANSQRILAAQFENSKAKLGESLAPALSSLIPVAENVAVGLGLVGLEISKMTGAVDPATAQLEQYALQFGIARDSAQLLGGALVAAADDMDSWTKAGLTADKKLELLTATWENLLDKFDGSPTQIKKLIDNLDLLVDSGELTSEEAERLAELLEDELADAYDEAAGAAKDYIPEIKELTREQENNRDATEETTDAIKEQANELRAQVDPLFNAIRTADKLTEAQIKVAEAVAEYGPNSREARAAIIDLGEAEVDANQAAKILATEGTAESIEALEDMLRQAGAGEEAIRFFIEAIEELNATPVDPKRIVDDSGEAHSSRGHQKFAHGGVVQGPTGSPQLVLAHAGETILPTHKPGFTTGPSTVVNYYAGTQIGSTQALNEIVELARRQ